MLGRVQRAEEEVERELGITDSVKLASNENPVGPSPLALAAAREALADVHRYPDDGGWALRQKLAAHLGFAADGIVVGAGSSELIRLAVGAYVGPGDEAVMAAPAFVVYKLAVTAAAGRPVSVVSVPGLVTPFFAAEPPRDFAAAGACDLDAYGRFARALLDDAAMFPPGLAPLAEAVPAHRRHESAPYAGLVGPLVAAADALDELAGLLPAGDGPRLPLTVTVPGGPAAAAARHRFGEAGARLRGAVRSEDRLRGLHVRARPLAHEHTARRP